MKGLVQVYALWILTAFLTMVNADVVINNQPKGTYKPSNGEVSVKMGIEDDSINPNDPSKFGESQSGTISICAGKSNSFKCFKTVKKLDGLKQGDFEVTMKSDLVPDGYYFFQIYASFDRGASIHYSHRFKLENMDNDDEAIKVTTPTPASTIKPTATGETPTDSENNGMPKSHDPRSYKIPYGLQSGVVKFAPMQTQPGSKTTYSTWSRRFPTSSLSIYTTYGKRPTVRTTTTSKWDYTPTSLVNGAKAAAYPTYFYPASSKKVLSASMTASRRRNRWI